MRKAQILSFQNWASHLQLVVIMRNVYIYWLLSVWSIMETTPLSKTGHVGGEVSFTCSNWNVWTPTEGNTKYFCKNECWTTDTIAIAESGKTTINDRFSITNSGKDLLVSITKLKKSDSGKYKCALEREFLANDYIEVHLNVEDVKKTTTVTTVKKTTPVTKVKMTITASTPQHPDVSTMFSIVSSTTMLHGTSSSSSSLAGWLVGLAVVLAVTVVTALMFYIKRTRKPQVVIFSAINPTDDDRETRTNEETRGEEQSTENPSIAMSPVYATVNKTNQARPTSIYANVNDYTHQDPTDLTYSTVLFSEDSRVTFSADLHPNQDTKMSQSSSLVPSVNVIPDDDFYSMAQLPKDVKENYGH